MFRRLQDRFLASLGLQRLKNDDTARTTQTTPAATLPTTLLPLSAPPLAPDGSFIQPPLSTASYPAAKPEMTQTSVQDMSQPTLGIAPMLYGQ